MDIFKILALIFISAILTLLFKDKRSEYSLLIAVLCVGIVLTIILKAILSPIAEIEQRIESYGIDNRYFKVALKALGIGYVTSFISESCKDAGQSALAKVSELAGKCEIFLLAAPLVLNILETAIGFIK